MASRGEGDSAGGCSQRGEAIDLSGGGERGMYLAEAAVDALVAVHDESGVGVPVIDDHIHQGLEPHSRAPVLQAPIPGSFGGVFLFLVFVSCLFSFLAPRFRIINPRSGQTRDGSSAHSDIDAHGS